MSALFGVVDKTKDLHNLIQELMDGSDALVNETVAGSVVDGIELDNKAEQIKDQMHSHYSNLLPSDSMFDAMLTEDANNTAQLFVNGVRDMTSLQESATLPNLVTLTASIATTMRIPYEAVLHRLFDTQTIDKQMVEIETVVPTVQAPSDDTAESLVDAFAPSNATPFVDKTEIMVDTLVDGIANGAKNVALLAGKNALFKVNRDARVLKVDASINVHGTPTAVPAANITMAKGTVPYFDAKTSTVVCMFEIIDNLTDPENPTTVMADVTAKINFDTSTLEYLRADSVITKVYFYATVSHQEHTHPIKTTFENRFEQYIVPTRPHIEVSLPQEMRTDIANSIQHFSSVDIVTAMTENITVISSRLEDQRLKKALDEGHEYSGTFNFIAPDNFAYGNLEWLKREFIPFLDQCAMMMRNDWNISDCHFRVAVSPYILRVIDTDYTMDKSLTEESKGSGVINYSIGVKTSTSVFYFISSQQITDNVVKILLIPNNFKNSQVKTYNYFKYSSFLTDQLRRSDNSVQPAIVYSERNLPIVFEKVSTDVTISGLAITSETGPYTVKKSTT